MSLIDDLRKGLDKQQQAPRPAVPGGKAKGPGAFKIPEPGYYGVYVCPPNAATHPWPFVKVLTHSKVGPERKIHPCLSGYNTFIWSDAVQEAIAQRNKRVEKEGHPDWKVDLDPEQGCPTCNEVDDSDSGLDFEQRKDMAAKDDYWGNIVPWYFQGLGPQDPIRPYPNSQKVIRGHFCKAQHAEKIHGWMTANGIDVTDPNAVVLMRLKRVGKEFTNTRYDLEVDPKTLRSPFKLPPPVMAQLKTLEVGQVNDPVLAIVGRIRSYQEIQSWLGHAPPMQGNEGEEEAEPEEPPCFKDPEIHDPNDAYCQQCPFFDPCAEAVAAKKAKAARPAPSTAGKPSVSAGKPAATGKAPAPHPAQGKPGNGQQRPPVATSQQEQGDIPGAEEAADFMRAVSTEPDDNGYAEEPDNSDPFGAEFEAAVEEARKGG